MSSHLRSEPPDFAVKLLVFATQIVDFTLLDTKEIVQATGFSSMLIVLLVALGLLFVVISALANVLFQRL